MRYAALFLVTLLTTTLTGLMMLSPEMPSPVIRTPTMWIGYVVYVPELYFKLLWAYLHLAATDPALLWQGASFALSLMAILTAHEFGHYIACRRYKVNSTLPFFIPSPPMIGPGTFGAFIKIRSAIPSRRALFDIGLAGPLAGFVVIIPVAIVGLLTMHTTAAALPGEGTVYFNDPLLMRLLGRALGVDSFALSASPLYLSAWLGLLVTSLNLLPVGQLDGGHAVYALFGKKVHQWLGRIAFVVMAGLSVLGWFWHGSPSGFLYVILLAVMLRVRHPQPHQTEPLGAGRIFVALVTLLVFALSFWPFPVTFS
jgi:membrane-associated protease RseP (regulator of RpoE activity)